STGISNLLESFPNHRYFEPVGVGKKFHRREGGRVFGNLFGKKSGSLESGTTIRPDGLVPMESLPANAESHLLDNQQELDGLTIDAYASRQGISTEQVWEKLRRGQLVGRTSRGQVLVYESIGAAALAVPAANQSTRASQDGDLPPLEFGGVAGRDGGQDHHQQSLMTVDGAGAMSNSTELALLLDHLSLAKEENREILRLTQDTLTKLSAMTDAVVQMKDEVIKSKDVQLADLQRALTEKEQNIAKLRQEKEDLEMLNRTLGEAAGLP
ncbi:MAG: hypothetical protein RIQ81_585, partial [Pseudomonadota bacterium]